MAYRVFLSDDINVVELDTDSIDIHSVFSLTDLEDITARNADIKQIDFKGTKNNDSAFGTFFDLSRLTDLHDSNRLLFNYNPLRSVLCLVYSDSNLIFKGSLRVSNISIGKKGERLYSTVITAPLIDIKTVIQDRYLTDLDFSDLKHHYSLVNIANSWESNTERYNTTTSGYSFQGFEYGSGYVYPLIDYGYSGYTGSSVNDIDARNFKPAVYVKEYMDRIFNQETLSGYTYEIIADSGFTQMFNQLVIPDAQEGLKNTISGFTMDFHKPTSLPVDTYFNYWQLTYTGVDVKRPRIDSVTVSDSTTTQPVIVYSGYSESGYRFLKVVRDFSSSAVLSVDVELTNQHGNGVKYQLGLFDYSVIGNPLNSPIALSEEYTINYGDVQRRVVTLNVPLNNYKENQILSIGIKVTLPGAPWNNNGSASWMRLNTKFYDANINLPNGGIYNYDVYPSVTSTGDTITPKPPVNIKQVDFLKSIMNLFNFFVYSKMDNHKHLIFQKYDDFYAYTSPQYLTSTALNWSSKIDHSKGINIKSNIDLPKSYMFTFKEDTDWFNEFYKKKFNQIYGQFSFEDEWGLTEQKKMELVFSPTPVITEIGSSRKYPALYKNSSNNKALMKTNIRILYYNGRVSTSELLNYRIIENGVVLSTAGTYRYPQVSNYYEISGTPINDIHFNQPNEVYFNLSNEFVGLPNSYSNYYINQTGDLTSPDVVYLECYILLNDSDISNLDLRIPVYINSGTFNGSYFKIIKIEYDGNEVPSKVILQKIVYQLDETPFTGSTVTPTPTPTPTGPTPTPTPTPTATPTPTPTGYTIYWALDVFGLSGSLDVTKNGSSVVSVTSNTSGSFTALPGDVINVTSACSTATNPLTAEMTLIVYDNVSYLHNNTVQGIPSVCDSYGTYSPTGDGNIIATATEV